MSDCVIVRTEEGLAGLGERNRRAFAQWLQMVKGLEVGETVRFSWKEPRNPKFHALFFVFIGELFDQQEQFVDDTSLRAWLTVGAGYAEFVPGPTGRMVAMPKSIAWENMDEGEFRLLVAAVWAFMRTEHAQGFLWPTTPPAVRSEAVERLLEGFENNEE